MSIAKEKQMRKSDFEVTFQDSPEYFIVENAKMIQEGNLIRFICFDKEDRFKEDLWYPMVNVYRIKRYPILDAGHQGFMNLEQKLKK